MFIAKLGEAVTDTSIPQAMGFIESLIADAADGAYLDFSDLTRMWQDSAGTASVVADANPVGKISSRYGSGSAIQITAGQFGLYKNPPAPGIWRGDGSNDWMDVQGFSFGGGVGNTMSMKITPNAASAGRSFMGFSGANRFSIGLSASGFLLTSAGSGGASSVTGTVDVRSQTVVVTATHDEDTIYLYRNATLVGAAALAGSVATGVGPGLGAVKAGAAPPSGGWTGCDIYKALMLGGRSMTADEVAELVDAWA